MDILENSCGFIFIKMKRKIVKVIHKNGEVDYTIKKQILPFIWITDSFDYWYGPGICEVMLRGMPLKDAEEYIENLQKEKEKYRGNKIYKKENYKISNI